MLIGQLVAGRYRLDEEVGAGGMGVVWKSTDIQLGRVVALKRAYTRTDGSMREARAAAALQHPNVVVLFDVLDDCGDQWLVMEYVPARSLAEIVGCPAEPLAPAKVAAIGAQLAGALQAVHAIGTLHRDVKPGNVLITDTGVAKLCDFGISRSDWGDPTLTGEQILGTPAYLAPEVANGQQPTLASDLFALGATLYYAVEGCSPYGEQTVPADLVRRAARGQVLAPRRAGPLTSLLGAMLQRDPRRRPDIAQVAEMCTRIIEVAELDAPTQPRDERGPGARRRRVVTIAAAVAGVGVIAAASLLVVRDKGDPAHAAGSPATVRPSAMPVLGMGEHSTADPCALFDVNALRRFGTPELSSLDDNYGQCDVRITKGGEVVDLGAVFDDGDVDPNGAAGPLQRVGRLQMKRLPAQIQECDREIGLPDHTKIELYAQDGSDNNMPNSPYCAIADAAANHALTLLSKGPVPRRAVAFPSDSLARVDACGLLNSAALRAVVPGVDVSHPAAEFGNWECTWRSASSRTSVDLFYNRQSPTEDADGTKLTLAGHQAFAQPPDYHQDSCEVDTVNSHLKDNDGAPLVEMVGIEVSGEQSQTQKCKIATKLAGAAALMLPR